MQTPTKQLPVVLSSLTKPLGGPPQPPSYICTPPPAPKYTPKTSRPWSAPPSSPRPVAKSYAPLADQLRARNSRFCQAPAGTNIRDAIYLGRTPRASAVRCQPREDGSGPRPQSRPTSACTQVPRARTREAGAVHGLWPHQLDLRHFGAKGERFANVGLTIPWAQATSPTTFALLQERW